MVTFTIGVGFALFWATAVSEIDNYFPPTQRSVAQGILAGLYGGLGTGFGCFLGGYLFENYGGAVLYQGAATVTALSVVVFLVGRIGQA